MSWEAPERDGGTGITGYAVAYQLRYEVSVGAKTVKAFAGRDVFVWPSLRPAGGGERVATFPLNYPLKNKTYAYYICNDTFPDTAEVTGIPNDGESRGTNPYQTKARFVHPECAGAVGIGDQSWATGELGDNDLYWHWLRQLRDIH